jgi:four helix bundle protein
VAAVSSMAAIRSYRDLIAWQKAMELVVVTYRQSSRLPNEEKFGLRAQIRRCAVGIPANIAEGWGRRSTGDYTRFLNIAIGSTFELVTHAEVSQRLGFDGDWDEVLASAHEVGRILNALIRSIENRPASPNG